MRAAVLLCFELDQGSKRHTERQAMKNKLGARSDRMGFGRGQGGLLLGLALLGALGCNAEEEEEMVLASIELDDGNVVTFEKFGDGVAVSETGLASNGSHLSGLNMKPVDVFQHLAPGRVVPDALLEDDARTTYSQELPAGTILVPSREAFEALDLSNLDPEQLEVVGAVLLERSAVPPERPAAPRERPAARHPTSALGQLAAAQLAGNQCDSFAQNQCDLSTAGLFGGLPDDRISEQNIHQRIDDSAQKLGVHSLCAAGEDGRLLVTLPARPAKSTNGFELVPLGSFKTVAWEQPRICSNAEEGRTVCFQDTIQVVAEARSQSNLDFLPPASSGIHYCRAYDSNG
jgi:hypothetical protein